MDTHEQCQTVVLKLPNESLIYDILSEVNSFYKPIHTYLSIFMCVLGTAANFCNIVVLTRRSMRTPVNMILTAMACCDTVVLFSNLVYTTHYQFIAFANCHPHNWSYGWALFLVAHAHISLVGHSSSVWLSVMLALIRYLTLRGRGESNNVQIGLKHSYAAIALVVTFVGVMNAPNFLVYKITEAKLGAMCDVLDPSIADEHAYLPGISDLATMYNCLVFRLAFWISGTVFKMVPCILLTLFVFALLRILKEVKAKRERLLKSGVHQRASLANCGTLSATGNSQTAMKNGGTTPISGDSSTAGVAPLVRNHSQRGRPSVGANSASSTADRTTQMLLTIVFVMLVTEMPQGVMGVLTGITSEEFRKHIYNNVGDLLDMLSLCGACSSFIIYCTMSGQFRNEFRRVFLPRNCRWLDRMISDTTADGATTTTGGGWRRPSAPVSRRALRLTTVSTTLNTASTVVGNTAPLPAPIGNLESVSHNNRKNMLEEREKNGTTAEQAQRLLLLDEDEDDGEETTTSTKEDKMDQQI